MLPKGEIYMAVAVDVKDIHTKEYDFVRQAKALFRCGDCTRLIFGEHYLQTTHFNEEDVESCMCLECVAHHQAEYGE